MRYNIFDTWNQIAVAFVYFAGEWVTVERPDGTRYCVRACDLVSFDDGEGR